MRLDRRRLRYPLGVVERGLEGQPVVHGLYKTEATMLVQWRLILGRGEAMIVHISPGIGGAKATIVSIVVLVVHADLGHEGIVHLPGGAGLSLGIWQAKSAIVSRISRARARSKHRRRRGSWLRRFSRTADCMHDKQSFLGAAAIGTLPQLQLRGSEEAEKRTT